MPQISQDTQDAPARKRVRLAPEVRKQLILDAALVEFSLLGFSGATTERIAQRAEMSQAGIYAHFKSKDEILEALVAELLTPKWGQLLRADMDMDDEAIDGWIDQAHALIAEPKFLAVLRILIAEGSRMPQQLLQWRNAMFKPYLAEQQRIADVLVQRGEFQDNILTSHFQLVSSPVVHSLLLHLIFGSHQKLTAEETSAFREMHRQMFKQLVARRAPAPAAGKRVEKSPTASSSKAPARRRKAGTTGQ